MNYATHRISLDIHRPESQTVINMKRGDTSRRIKISLTEDGRPYTLTSDCSAVFKAKKPDGNNIYLDCVIEGNVIIYNVSSQTTASLGEVDCEIMLFNETGELLTSPRFTIIVNDTVHSQGSIVESDSEAKTKLIKLLKDNTKSAVEDYLKENPITGVSEEQAKNIKDNTLARHSHSNMGVLEKFGEESGKLTFDGVPVNASKTKTVELDIDNFEAYIQAEDSKIFISTVDDMFDRPPVPDNAKLVSLEAKMPIENEMTWIDLNMMVKYDLFSGYNLIMDRAFTIAGMDNATYLAAVFYNVNSENFFYTAVLKNEVRALRVTFIDEG